MKKIRSEFFTETEANEAMEKINAYCGNVRIIYNDENFNQGYDYIGNDDFYGFPGMGAMNYGDFGSFGMIGGWNFPIGLDNNINRVLSHSNLGHNHTVSRRTTLEADVADDNIEYVREKLYSLGAISVS